MGPLSFRPRSDFWTCAVLGVGCVQEVDVDTKPIRDALWRLATLDSGVGGAALVDAARQSLLKIEQAIAVADAVRKAAEPWRAQEGARDAATGSDEGWDLVWTCEVYDRMRGTK